MLRYHGVLAGHSNGRAEVVPHPDDDDDEPETLEPQLCLFEPLPYSRYRGLRVIRGRGSFSASSPSTS